MTRDFLLYATASVVSTIAVLVNAIHKQTYFYPTVIYLVTSNIATLVLGNLAILSTIVCGKLIQAIFLGKLSTHEIEAVKDNSRFAVVETLLALTLFRRDLGVQSFILFAMLFFFKIFHWILEPRVDGLVNLNQATLRIYVKVAAFIVFLACIDIFLAFIFAYGSLYIKGMSYFYLFTFEYAILLLDVWTIGMKFILYLIGLRRGPMWQNKPNYMFAIELSTDLLRFVLNIAFFIILATEFGLPIHLVRPLYRSYHVLRNRFIRFIAYRKLIVGLRNRFPSPSETELEAVDYTCIICRENMTRQLSKKIPCGHIFHFDCLKTWLERSNTCPTCRAAIPLDGDPPAADQGAENAADVNDAVQQNGAELQGRRLNVFHVPRFAEIPVNNERQDEGMNDDLYDDEKKEITIDDSVVGSDVQNRQAFFETPRNQVDLLREQTRLIQEQIMYHTRALDTLNGQLKDLVALQVQFMVRGVESKED